MQLQEWPGCDLSECKRMREVGWLAGWLCGVSCLKIARIQLVRMGRTDS